MICIPRIVNKGYMQFSRSWRLDVDSEIIESIGLETPICQVCHSPTKFPFYFCYDYKRIICMECERDPSAKATCQAQFRKDNHIHILVTDILILDSSIEQKREDVKEIETHEEIIKDPDEDDI